MTERKPHLPQTKYDIIKKGKKIIDDEHCWIYGTKCGKIITHLFSLEGNFAITTSFIISILTILYTLLDVYVENYKPALSIAIIIYVYCFGIFGFHIYLLITLKFYSLRDTNYSPTKFYDFIKIAIIMLALLYIITIIQNAVIYSIITKIDENAFVGISADLDNISRIGLSLYFSVETITGLSTGGAAFPDRPAAYITVSIQSSQSVVLFYLMFGIVISFIYTAISDMKIKHDEAIKNLLGRKGGSNSSNKKELKAFI